MIIRKDAMRPTEGTVTWGSKTCYDAMRTMAARPGIEREVAGQSKLTKWLLFCKIDIRRRDTYTAVGRSRMFRPYVSS